MKKLLFLPILLITFNCGSTKTISKTTFTKEKIVPDLKYKKNELYIKANTWMVDTFNNPESVIEFSDKESGTILGKYLIQGNLSNNSLVTIDTRLFAKIDIRLKDNTAKIKIEPLTDVATYGQSSELELNIKINTLIQSFTTFIKSKNEDW